MNVRMQELDNLWIIFLDITRWNISEQALGLDERCLISSTYITLNKSCTEICQVIGVSKICNEKAILQ